MDRDLGEWIDRKLEEGVDKDLLIEVLTEKKGLKRSDAEELIANREKAPINDYNAKLENNKDNYEINDWFSIEEIRKLVNASFNKKVGYFLLFAFAIFGLSISGNYFEIMKDDTTNQETCNVSFDAELINIEDVDLIEEEDDNLDFILKPEIEGSDSINVSFVFTRTFNGFEGGVERYTPENNTIEIEDGEEFQFEQKHEEVNLFKYDYLSLIPDSGSETCGDFSERFSIPHLD